MRRLGKACSNQVGVERLRARPRAEHAGERKHRGRSQHAQRVDRFRVKVDGRLFPVLGDRRTNADLCSGEIRFAPCQRTELVTPMRRVNGYAERSRYGVPTRDCISSFGSVSQ